MAERQSEFDNFYRHFHELRQSAERTRAEVAGLVEALGIEPGEHVLDLACGWGVHLAELERRGFGPLVGVDAQQSYLEQAAGRLEGVRLLERDATFLGFRNEFDAVYVLYNTLFASDDETHLAILLEIARALKPGGRFLLDTTNRERVARTGKSQSWQAPEAGLPWLLRESVFDPATGDQQHVEHLVFGDRVDTRRFKRRHYTLKELTDWLQRAGLRLRAAYGSLGLEPYTVESPRMIVVADKEGEEEK